MNPQITRAASDQLPRISIVTPSYNQSHYLDKTLRSLFDQQYPALESVVVDGGSTDGSMEIVRQYGDRIAWSVSERDGGQYDALNKGFARTSGEIMGWLNSDDIHLSWTLSLVGEIFATFPEIEWLTTLYPLVIDRRGRATRCMERPGYSAGAFKYGEYFRLSGKGFEQDSIQQESTFWRRSLWEKAGGKLDTQWKLAGDYDLWARFFQHARLYALPAPLSCFRLHGDQRSVQQQTAYRAECQRIWKATGWHSRSVLGSHLRKLALNACPRPLQRFAAKSGLLHEGGIVRKARNSDEWVLQSVYC